MRRYMVVAHQTLGSPELLDAMRDRLAEGPCTFHLVVPVLHGGQGLTWTEGKARTAAAERLEEARLRFIAEGLAVSGEVGDAHPVDAVRDVLVREGDDAFDGVIVSTLPHAISKWLKFDSPNRIHRNTGLPVFHVVGHPVHA
jgi:hypothetical protein